MSLLKTRTYAHTQYNHKWTYLQASSNRNPRTRHVHAIGHGAKIYLTVDTRSSLPVSIMSSEATCRTRSDNNFLIDASQNVDKKASLVNQPPMVYTVYNRLIPYYTLATHHNLSCNTHENRRPLSAILKLHSKMCKTINQASSATIGSKLNNIKHFTLGTRHARVWKSNELVPYYTETKICAKKNMKYRFYFVQTIKKAKEFRNFWNFIVCSKDLVQLSEEVLI